MPDGQDMAEAIVKAGYAVNYDDGRRLGWCRYRRWIVIARNHNRQCKFHLLTPVTRRWMLHAHTNNNATTA